MALIVQKFGGSSVCDASSIRRVAELIVNTHQAGHSVVVVVSAMGDMTDDLIDMAQQVSPLPPQRELDILLTAGERISMALLAMAIDARGIEARSYTGSQAGLITDDEHGHARIVEVVPRRIAAAIETGAVAIVAGFQGVGKATKDITTLGRGGSDTTAVALAAALKADVCEIYTDVDGVFTADPRVVPNAAKLGFLTYEEMLEMAAGGAKILMPRCVEYARRYNVPLHVRSSFSGLPGTRVGHEREGTDVEAAIISGVAHDRTQAKVTVVGLPDVPGVAASVFEAVATTGVDVDMIVQNVSAVETGMTDISFTLPRVDGIKARVALEEHHEEIGYERLLYDDEIGKLTLVGAGMRSAPGVSAKLFGALRDAQINIEMISTSEIRISVIMRQDQLDTAIRAVHTAFALDSDAGEAVVYGGTGR